MSKQITLQQWASILPHKVEVKYNNVNYILKGAEGHHLYEEDVELKIYYSVHHVRVHASECIPHLRPLSSLTKEITVDGYNDGKTFVPISRLQEEYTDHILEFERPDCILLKEDYSFEQNVLGAPLAIIQKLLEWHFAVGFEEGQYIPI